MSTDPTSNAGVRAEPSAKSARMTRNPPAPSSRNAIRTAQGSLLDPTEGIVTGTSVCIRDLRWRVPDREVLRGISLEVAAGSVVALLGPNGAGKTSLLRVLATLVVAEDQAVMQIGGYDAVRDPVAARKQLSYVGQPTGFRDHLTAEVGIRFVASMYGIPAASADARMREIASTFGCVDALHRPFGELSKGTQQKLVLTRAFVVAPPVLLLDEPGDGLDPVSRVVLYDRIRTHRDAGGSVLLATHDLSEVLAVADRVVYLVDGQVRLDSQLHDVAGDRPTVEALASALGRAWFGA